MSALGGKQTLGRAGNQANDKIAHARDPEVLEGFGQSNLPTKPFFLVQHERRAIARHR